MKIHEEIEAMTEEELRIATAKLCGWTNIKSVLYRGDFIPCGNHPDILDDECNMPLENNKWGRPIPDYLNSLDAMAEALDKMPHRRWAEYLQILEQNLKATAWEMHTATARQRNTAFLMILL